MLNYLTAGESHGEMLLAIVEGLPYGLKLSLENINKELERRQIGVGRGGRMKIEKDRAIIVSGVRNSITLGTPIGIIIKNKDWENWQNYMSPFSPPVDDSKEVYIARPGHADLGGAIRNRDINIRNVIERSSARNTATRVAIGAISKQFLEYFNIKISSFVYRVGNAYINPEEINQILSNEEIDKNPVRAPYKEIGEKMKDIILKTKEKKDTIGGSFEVRIYNFPPGIGSYSEYYRRLTHFIASEVFGTQAFKSMEIGLGSETSKYYGSQVHDQIYIEENGRIYRKTNNAGGIEGGISNSEVIRIKITMKPIPTLMQPLDTIDLKTKKMTKAHKERSDVCAIEAASVVGENIIAIALAKAILYEYGMPHINDIKEAIDRLNSFKNIKNF